MRVVCWGGPLHDQVVDVPTEDDGGPRRVFVQELVDAVDIYAGPYVDPIARREAVRVAYRAMRLDTGPGNPLPRDRREPRWWWIYVPDVDPAAGQRYLETTRRPLVDGPVRPHPSVVARDKRLAAPEHDDVPVRA